jgi:hypothetical protein
LQTHSGCCFAITPPLSFFGDFHQRCVANPLGTDASRRYERGIHYTPAPIVDYLVKRFAAALGLGVFCHNLVVLAKQAMT